MIIAHRGASHDAPENTLAAFRLAWRQGADGIEGDFRLTEDGHIVCMHDATTRRTTDQNLSVAESTMAQLQRLDAGSWKGPPWRQERIPTLDQVLATVPQGKQIFIEVKCGPEILPALKETLKQSRLTAGQVAVISFDQTVIAEAKRQLPHLKAFWLTGLKKAETSHALSPTVEEILDILLDLHADGVDLAAHPPIDQHFVDELGRANKTCHVWTVDDLPRAQWFCALGIESLTTNQPGWLRQQLKK